MADLAPGRYVMDAPTAFFKSRAGLFVVLAFLLAAQNTYASTLAASLFLSHLGAAAIPIYYVLFAVVSIPCSTLLSIVIDRYPRSVIFKYMLGIFTVISLAMAALLGLRDHWYYVVYIGISVCEQLLYSVYYLLFADFFSVTDAKRATARVATGMTGGGLAGGAGIAFVTSLAGPRIALLMTPMLVGIVIVYFGWVMRRHRPLETIEAAAEESLTESLRVMPRLLRLYPMVALLAAAVLLNVFLQCVSEYLAFSIYTIHFPRVDALATFLGFVNAGLNLLGFVIVIGFTDRQMPRLGVPVMNRIYPALNILSFGVLTLSQSLPAGILANIAYDPFVHSIDVPVVTMNYNAIRYRLVGRVRVFNDGIIYPLAIATAGVALAAFQNSLSLRQVALGGLVLSALLFVLHYRMGTEYIRGLLDMLRDGVLDFDKADPVLRLPAETIAEIRAMLRGNPQTAYAGLQAALSCNHEFAGSEIAPALAAIPVHQARAVVERLTQLATPARRQTFEQLARSEIPAIRQLAHEALAQTVGPPIVDSCALLNDPHEGICSVAAATILVAEPKNLAARAVLNQPLGTEAALGAISVLRLRSDDGVMDLLLSLGQHADARVRAAALLAAGSVNADNLTTLNWAQQAATDQAVRVREAAFAILARAGPTNQLDAILDAAWTDHAFQVRHAIVDVLAARGKEVLPAVHKQLTNGREEAQLAAIEVIGRIEGPAAEATLLKMLQTTAFPALAFGREHKQSVSPNRQGWKAMSFAVADGIRRAQRLITHTLEALGHRRTVNLVRTALEASDERTRASAVESLASLPWQQFVAPLTPLLEGRDAPLSLDEIGHGQALQTLRAAQSANDEGLRAAAAIAWQAETGDLPPGVLKDSSKLVAETALTLLQRGAESCPYRQEVVMNRLAFLHSVPLFAKATLDDLIVIDRSLTCESYLGGETIVSEGGPGDRLCIIYRGEVSVHKHTPGDEHELARLGAGDFFGEMSLFDDEPRSATVSAVNEVEVLVLNRDRFHSLVQQRPAFLIGLCTTLVRRLRKTTS